MHIAAGGEEGGDAEFVEDAFGDGLLGGHLVGWSFWILMCFLSRLRVLGVLFCLLFWIWPYYLIVVVLKILESE